MSRVWILLIALALQAASAGAQFLGMGNGRAHPELDWQEFETEHFLIVYPRHLEATAVKAASIAEQVYEPILQGMELERTRRKIAITLTEEDQIVNGFALPGKMFLWVNQNDGAQFFSGTEKWLRKVIAHELQHDMWMEAAQDWTGVWGLFGTPAWFVEGLAEYETEEWGAYRSDLRVRDHILRNRQDDLDPHDSGFTRVRYLAETYGDSVITGAIHKRGWLGLTEFGDGFEEKAGITLKEFEEEWRRVANAYTYAIWSQKERVTDVGEAMRVPMQRPAALEFSPDGSQIAVLAQPERRALPVLALVANDSTQTTTELDHGMIDRDFGFDPAGRWLVYAKLHRVAHGSLLWDLKIVDVESGESRWLTEGRRASHPSWSPDGNRIVCTVVDGETTNLALVDPESGQLTALTEHEYDTQCFSPRFAPDGNSIVFGKFEAGRHLDLAVLDLTTHQARYLTDHPRRDLRPRWSADGRWIYFTSDRGEDHVPNLFRVAASGGEGTVVQMSDVGEALFAMDVDPADGSVAVLAMASTDTTRLRLVEADRMREEVAVEIDPRLTDWRTRVPPLPVGETDPSLPVERSESRSYRSWRHMRPLLSLVLPSFQPWGIQFGTLWADASHKTSVMLGGDVGTNEDDEFTWRGVYLGLETIRPPLLPGTLGLWTGTDALQGFRIYDDELIYDVQSGFGFRWQQPFNFGEHLYANHMIEVLGRYTDVDVIDFEDLDFSGLPTAGLPFPDDRYVESILGLRWHTTHRRPRPERYGHPQGGFGAYLSFAWSDEAIGSDYDYRRFDLDMSHAPELPWLGRKLLARARYQATWGDTAPQDFTGLRADPRILPVYYGSATMYDDLFDIGDSYALRGYPVNVPGTRALMTTLELRQPLLDPLPVQAFGLSPGGLTGVLFYDHGRVYDASGEIEARHTVGWELRIPIHLGSSTLLVPSYGEGQTLEWENEGSKIQKDEYFRMAFTQSF